MKDLSYHILDIVQNSLHAGAMNIEIDISESAVSGRLCLKVSDDGCGMTALMSQRVADPFFTTSVKKKVGLGLPLLKQNAEQTGGTFTIESAENKGTLVTATFDLRHIDMIPVGDLASTFKILIAANPEEHIIYRHTSDRYGFELDTAEIRDGIGGISLNTREVLEFIVEFINNNLKEL